MILGICKYFGLATLALYKQTRTIIGEGRGVKMLHTYIHTDIQSLRQSGS